MVPLSEYATVSEESTLMDAMFALEKAQAEFDHTKYRHRSVLVLDKNKKIVGKLSFIDALNALGSHHHGMNEQKELDKFGFSSKFLHHMYMQQHYVNTDVPELYKKASKLKVVDLMQALTKGEYIEDSVPIKTAIFQLVSGNHLGLLVTRKNDIVGILRLTDVFAAVFHTMKACENSS
jgi:CBS domain-containing protein